MDINFQFGEFINESSANATWWTIVGVILSPIISVLIAIGVFAAGKRHDRSKEHRRIELLRNFLSASLRDLLEAIDKQINEYQELSEKLTSGRQQHFQLKRVVNLHVDWFKELSNTDVFHIYVVSRAAQSSIQINIYKNLRRAIDLIDNIKSAVPQQHELFINELNGMEKDITQLAEEIRSKGANFASILRAHRINPQKHQAFSVITNIYQKYIQDRTGNDYEDFRNGLVYPIINAARNLYDSRFGFEILELTIKAKRLIETIEYVKGINNKFLQHYVTQLKEAKAHIEKAIL